MAPASQSRKQNMRSTVTGIFRNRSLRNKIILTFLLVTLLSIGGITYVNNRATSERLTTQAGRNLEELAAARALNIGTMIARNVDALQSFSLGTDVGNKIDIQNSIYAGQYDNEWAVRSELRERDEVWKNADKDDAIKRGRLENVLAEDLREFAETFPGITELVVTDKYGGLLAANFESPDYYQGDEVWWQDTYNRGNGRVYISDPQPHPGGRRIMRIAVPVYSNETETGGTSQRETIGVIGGLLDSSTLADILENTNVGQTGAAEMLFQTSSYIFGPRNGDYTFYSISEPGAEAIGALKRAPRGNTQMALFGRDSFVANAPITSLEEHPYIDTLGWQVIVHQDKSEALQVVEETTRTTSLLAAAIAAIVILVGVVMGQHFARPILTLSEAMTRFTGGDLSTRVHIQTGDETGTLASHFNEMADQMSGLFQQLESRRNELEQRTRQLDANQRAISVIFAASKQSGPEELLGLVVDMIRDQFDLYHVQIYMVDDAGENAVLREGTGYAGRQLMQQHHSIALDQPALVSRAITQDEPVIVEDVEEAEDFLANPLLPDTESELVVPLRLDNHVIGALDVQSNRKHKFNRDMITLFQTMAEQIAFLFENSELLEQVSEQNEALTRFTTQLRAAAELGQRLGTIYEPDELLHETVELIQSRFGFYHAHIYLLHAQEGKLMVRAGSGEVGRVLREKNHSIPINADKSLVAQAAGNKDTILVNDVSLESDFLPNPLLPQTRSEVAVPLIVRGEVLGVLDVQDDQAERFDESDVNALNTLAGQVATALNSARLFEQLQNTLEQTRVRLQTNEALSTARTEKQVLETICEQASLYEDVQVTVFLVDDEEEDTYLEMYDSRALNSGLTELKSGQRFHIDELALSDYAFDDITFTSENALEDERVSEGVRTLMREAGAPSIAVIRIQIGADWFGVLTITSPKEQKFDQQRLRLYELVAERGALALREARLHGQLTRIGQAIENTSDAIVISDINGEAVYHNRAFTDLFGYTLQELNESGGAVALYNSEDDARRIFGEAVSGGTWNGELEMRSKRGNVVPVELRVDAFRDDEGNVVGAIGTMTDITERRTLREAGAVVAATLQRDEAIARILDQLDHVLEHDSASVQLLHDNYMEIVGGKGWHQPEEEIVGLQFPIPGDNPNTVVVEERRPVVLNSPQEIAEYPSFGEAPHEHIQSWMGVPLIFHDEVIGMLAMESAQKNAFSPGAAQLVSAFGDHVAIAIENSRLFEQTEETLVRIRTAAEITQQLSGVLDPDQLLHDVVDVLKSRFSLYHVHVYLVDDEEKNLVMSAGSGEVGHTLREREHAIPLDRDKSLVARAARNHATVYVEDTHTEPDFMANPLLPDTRSEVAVPLVSRGELSGVLDVQDNTAHRFSESDIDTLNTIAGQIATAVENARLFEQTEDALEGLRTSEERFRFLSEAVNEGVIVHEHGTILDVNDAGARMFGYDRSEMIGQSALMLPAPESRELIKQNMLSDNTEPYEAIGQRKDGSKLVAQIQGRPVTYRGRDARVVIVRDITQQTEAEEEMRRLNTMLVTQHETSPDGILIVNPDREFVFYNQRFTEIWDIPDNILETGSSEDALAHVRKQLKHPDEFVERSNDLYESRERSREEIDLKDGRVLDRFSAPMIGDDGTYYGRMWTFRDITEQKRAERALRESEQRYQILFEEAPISLWEEDFSAVHAYIDELRHNGVEDFRPYFEEHPDAAAHCASLIEIDDLNQTTVRLFDAGDKETLLTNLDTVFGETASPGAQDALIEQLTAIAEGREHVQVEAVNNTLTGERRHHRLTWSVAPGYEDTYGKVLVAVDDFTDRVQAEEALRESEARNRALVDAIPDLMYRLNQDGTFLDIETPSHHAEQYFYLPPDALLQHNVSDVFPFDVSEKIMHYVEQTIATGEIQRFEYQLPIGEGVYDMRDFEARFVVAGRTEILAIVRDITEQKAVQKREQRLTDILEATPDFVSISDVEGRPLYLNEAGRIMAGLEEDVDISETRIPQYHPKEMHGVVQEALQTAMQEGVWRGENVLLGKDGDRIPLSQVLIAHTSDDSGEVEYFSTIARDISDVKAAEEAMAKRLQYEEKLAAASQTLLSDQDIDASMHDVLEHLRVASGSSRVYFYTNIESTEEGTYAKRTHEACAPGVEPQIHNQMFQRYSYEEAGFGEWAQKMARGELVAGTIDDFEGERRQILERQNIKSVLLLPIITSEGWYGNIGFNDTEEKREWSPEDIRLLRTAAEMISNAIDRHHATENLERTATQLRTAADVSEQLSAILDPDVLLPKVVAQLQERFDLYHVHVYLANDEGTDLIMQAGSGEVGQKLYEQNHRIAFDHEQSIVARAARTREAILVEDTNDDPNFLPNPLLPDTRSEVAVPIVARGDVLGVFDVQDNVAHRFAQSDMDVFNTLAGQIASALENARLFEQVQKNLEQTRIRFRVSQTLADTQTVDETLDAIISEAGFYPEAHVSIATRVPDADQETFQVRRSASFESNVQSIPAGFTFTEAEFPLLSQISAHEEFITSDLESEFGAVDKTTVAFARNMGARSVAVLPITYHNDWIGNITVISAEEGFFDDHKTLYLFQSLAEQGAVALHTARLFEEIQQTAERLREVDRLKSEFLANMSHELRTPLNSIIGYAEIMLMGIDGDLDDETLQDVQAIHENGQHLLELINDILDLAKIEAGRMKLDKEPVQIDALFEEVKTSHLGVLHQQKKNLNLEIDVEDQLPPIKADYGRLNQVLNNLVSNAIKFTDEGKIVMRAVKENGWLRVEVKDSGVGISRADQRRIFERFRQIDGSSTRAAEGTGLGLAITHHLVEMHGGTIDVESELGEGATFVVRLPIHPKADENAASD